MNESDFAETLDELRATNSRNEKKEIIRRVEHNAAAISFLSGSEFDDAGVGKKTMLTVAQDVFGDSVDGKPTVSESLEEFDAGSGDHRQQRQLNRKELSELHEDMELVADMSGNDMKNKLNRMLRKYDHPSLVAFACLNDWPTGVGDSTIASAMGVKDSLPFYEGVHEIAADKDPITSPEVGRAFKPMLAKSESSLPDDLSKMWAQPKLDGYRLMIHISKPQNGSDHISAYTRRMNNVTESLPELQEIDWPQGQYIVDCEVIAEDGTYKSTSERIGRSVENVEREVDMEFGLFDIILQEEDVSHKPYRWRHGAITHLAGMVDDSAVYALQVYTDEAEAREAGRDHEGLIWKDPDAPYKFDKRSKAWIKEKNTAETIDLVASSFEEGEGRLDGTLGKVNLETADGVAVGATGSGFSDAERDEVWDNQKDYLGETIEVEGEAFDSGVRFPIFQRWRTDDGEPDSLDRVTDVLPEP